MASLPARSGVGLILIGKGLFYFLLQLFALNLWSTKEHVQYLQGIIKRLASRIGYVKPHQYQNHNQHFHIASFFVVIE
jgi:hypothetical protein